MLSGVTVATANEGFWAKAYSDNFGRLCSRASRRLTSGNMLDAEDTVSEAFFRVMRYAQNPDEIGNVASYLWTTVKRVWTSQQLRLSASRTDRLEDMNPEELESLDGLQVEPRIQSIIEEEEGRRQFRLKLGPMSLQELKLIDLYQKDYSFEEIAGQLGEDIRVTRVRWKKLIGRLRNRLANQTAGSALLKNRVR